MNKLDQGSYTVGPFSFISENIETGDIGGDIVVALTITPNFDGRLLLHADEAIELAADLMLAADKC